eukprot:TRINITY_DN1011_c0_g1_i3.p1 TRINITY_DN1011_c0_g1~~TRINITY_DN1011_c0_g1_i3.p1  ORF type:complete len:577 (-),score=41.36 TRINITY_DN1011_c0_g1_i3:983-2713(-)
MKNTFVFFYIFLSYVQCVDIPGCGALKNIKWNSSCMLSSTKQLHNLDQFVFSIKNLLLLDGIFYYLVPPNSSENYKSYMQSKFSRVTNNEIEFQVVDVAYSPLKIQRMVKEVKDYKMGVVFHSGNIKTFSHPQLVGLPFFYEPAGHLYHLLTRAFENSKTIETYRNSTMLLTTVSNQSNIDWETGTSMNCFSSDGLLHLSTSKLTRNTLYILRHVLIYLPENNNKHDKQKTQQLPQDVFNYCKNNGYAYDSSGDIQDGKKYNVSIGTIFKNEAQFLLEWIAYHTIVGVQHFYLFNDESTDEFMEVLQPLVEKNLVTLFNYSNTFLNSKFGFQQSFLKFLGDIYYQETKWLLNIDIDEFLVIKDDKYNGNINEFILQNEILRSETGSLQIGREAFAGNFNPIKKSELVTNKLTYKAGPSTYGKPMVNTNGLDRVLIHWGYTFAPIRNVRLEKNCIIHPKLDNISYDTNCVENEPISVFHYIVKSYDRCLAKMLEKTDWRVEAGQAYCKQMVSEYKYAPENYQRDFRLAYMTDKICDRMKLLNNKWYDKNSICQDYQFNNDPKNFGGEQNLKQQKILG